jgi:hypothetical protein
VTFDDLTVVAELRTWVTARIDALEARAVGLENPFEKDLGELKAGAGCMLLFDDRGEPAARIDDLGPASSPHRVLRALRSVALGGPTLVKLARRVAADGSDVTAAVALAAERLRLGTWNFDSLPKALSTPAADALTGDDRAWLRLARTRGSMSHPGGLSPENEALYESLVQDHAASPALQEAYLLWLEDALAASDIKKAEAVLVRARAGGLDAARLRELDDAWREHREKTTTSASRTRLADARKTMDASALATIAREILDAGTPLAVGIEAAEAAVILRPDDAQLRFVLAKLYALDEQFLPAVRAGEAARANAADATLRAAIDAALATWKGTLAAISPPR